MTEPLVEVVGVTKRFGRFTAVDQVDLDVRPGELVGLLGANGAGKTTLLQVILGLALPEQGHVRVLGGPPSRRTRTGLGSMPQGLGLYTELSVRENLEFVAGAFGLRRVPPLPASLAPLAEHQVSGIGLGLQRQLAFLCALLHEPRLLLLDEPTSGVDPLARARLWDTIHERRDNGVGILVSTHYMQEAEQCDRLVLLSHGRVVAAGTRAELVAGHQVCEVDGHSWAASFLVLSEAGLPVMLAGRTVRVAGSTPDEVRAVLTPAGITAQVRPSPATLAEVLVLLDR